MLSMRALTRGFGVGVISRCLCSASPAERDIIGCREVVGFGKNGWASYVDQVDVPFPAIRFLADNPYLQALKEKEKGDWRSLSLDEKKCLYRASFCQTFAEMTAPTGEWKSIIGATCFFLGVSLWCSMFVLAFVLGDLPQSCSEESQRAQLQRMLDLAVNPIEGISSKWDYDRNCWKK